MKNEDLRKNKLIFRIRQIRQGGWPDDSWELTFKCRAPEYDKAAAFDTNTTLTKLQRKKFKEELIRGDAPGTMAKIFSNNVIVEYPEIDVDFPLSRLAHALPHLATLGLDLNETLSIVAGAKVFEIQSTSNLFFGLRRRHGARHARCVRARPRCRTASSRWWRSSDSLPAFAPATTKKRKVSELPTNFSKHCKCRCTIISPTGRRRRH